MGASQAKQNGYNFDRDFVTQAELKAELKKKANLTLVTLATDLEIQNQLLNKFRGTEEGKFLQLLGGCDDFDVEKTAEEEDAEQQEDVADALALATAVIEEEMPGSAKAATLLAKPFAGVPFVPEEDLEEELDELAKELDA